MAEEVRPVGLAAGVAGGAVTAVILMFAVEAVFHGKAPGALAVPFLYALLAAALLASLPLPVLLKIVKCRDDEPKRFSLTIGYGVGIGLGTPPAVLSIAGGSGLALAALRFVFSVAVCIAAAYLFGPPIFRAFSKSAGKETGG